MATLTETAYVARKAVMFSAVALLSLLVGRFALFSFSRWWTATHPSPPPPPTVAFGILKELEFPPDRNREGFSYRLETISGTLPDFGAQARVYFMPAFRANVLGLELATALAARLEFLLPPVAGPTEKMEQRYFWKRGGLLPGTLSVDLVTGYFTFQTSWEGSSEIAGARAPSEQEAENIAKEFLHRGKTFENDLEKGNTKIEFLRVDNRELIPSISQSGAQVTRVHFFRAPVNDVPVVTSRGNSGLIQVVVSGVRRDKQVIAAQYRYSPVELERFETYPLRSPQEAWEQLQNGEGVVIHVIEGETVVTIREVELAYYDAEHPQEFFQPIYVFRGDDDFLAYVPAIAVEWLKKD